MHLDRVGEGFLAQTQSRPSLPYCGSQSRLQHRFVHVTKLGGWYFYDYALKGSLYIDTNGTAMVSLYLVDPGLDMSIELFISEPVERALALQWERLKDRSAQDAFCRRMTAQLESVIPESIDWDIKKPTPAQLSYAVVLSKQLGVTIPPEALRYRGTMHEFLEKRSQEMKVRREAKQGDT